MNIFKLSDKEFDKEMKRFEKYLDSLTNEEFIAELTLCGFEPQYKFPCGIIDKIKKKFCRHHYRINQGETHVICKKCGNIIIIHGRIPRYVAGGGICE